MVRTTKWSHGILLIQHPRAKGAVSRHNDNKEHTQTKRVYIYMYVVCLHMLSDMYMSSALEQRSLIVIVKST